MSEFDKYAATYRDAVNDAIAFSGLKVDTFVAAKLRHLRRILSAHGVGPHDPVLDIGCGVGTYEAKLVADWPGLCGIDVSAASIAAARAACPAAQFLAYEGKTFPVETGAIAAAFAICVWHHVPVADWELFVAEVARVLRPGGIFIVFEHNPWNPLTRWVVERCVFDKDAVLLSMPQVQKRLAREPALSVAEANYILSLPAAGGVLARVDDCFRKLPTGAQYYVVARKAR